MPKQRSSQELAIADLKRQATAPDADEFRALVPTGLNTSDKIVKRALTEVITKRSKADPVRVAQEMRVELDAASITELVGWLEQFTAEIKKNPVH